MSKVITVVEVDEVKLWADRDLSDWASLLEFDDPEATTAEDVVVAVANAAWASGDYTEYCTWRTTVEM